VPWAFAFPLLLFVLAVFVIPVADLIKESLQLPATAFTPAKWVGLRNFQLAWSDPLFRSALLHNATLFLCVPILIALSALLAALLFERVRFWKLHRIMIFIPYVLAVPVIGVVMGVLLQYNGVANTVLRDVGLSSLAADWLGSPAWALKTLMAIIIWKELGFGVMLFLARLLSVDEHLFEAARVDGAGWWRTFRHVTLPQLVPTIAFYAVVETITMLSWVFAYVYVLTGGGPENATNVTEYYIYQNVFTANALGVGAAAGVILLGLVGVIIVLRLLLIRRFDFNAITD
jgi:ABC-type sugar transport system permease subunit